MSHSRHYKEILKDTLKYFSFGGLLEGANILLMPVFVRLFSVSEYGMIDTLTLFTALCSIFVALCIPSALSRFYFELEPTERKRLFSSLLYFEVMVGTVLLLAAAVVSPFLSVYFENTENFSLYVTLAVAGGMMSALLSLVTSVLRIEREILWCQIINLSALFFYVTLTCLSLFLLKSRMTGVMISLVASSLLSFLLGLWIIRRHLVLHFSYRNLKVLLRYALPLMPAALGAWANSKGYRYLLITYLGLYYSGLYAAGSRLAAAVGILFSAFQQSWSFYSVSIIGQKEFKTLSEGILLYYLGVGTILAIAFLVFSREACLILLGAGYMDVPPLLPWLIGGVLLRGAATVANAGAILQKRSLAMSVATLLSLGLNIALSIGLIPYLGLFGAAVAYFLSECVTVIYLLWDTHTKTTVSFDKKQVWIIGAAYLIITNILVWEYKVVDSLLLRLVTGALGIFFLVRFTVLEKAIRKFILPRLKTA